MRIIMWRNKSGQGLVELAILGSILIGVIAYLLQVGINLNRYQDLSMRANRNARAMAYNPAFRDHSRHVSLVMTEDKPSMSYSSASLQKSYSPYTVSASSVWSDKLDWSYEASADNVDELLSSLLDLPTDNFLINGHFITLQKGSYAYKVYLAWWNGARQKEDCWPYVPPEAGCTRANSAQSWCWKNVKSKDIEDGSSVDFDGDGKEELVLRKIGWDDSFWGIILAKFGISLEDLGFNGALFLVIDSQLGVVDDTAGTSKNTIAGMQSQGLLAQFETKMGAVLNTFPEEKITLLDIPKNAADIPAEAAVRTPLNATVNTWEIKNSTQTTTHLMNLNPDSAAFTRVAAIEESKTIGKKSGTELPSAYEYSIYLSNKAPLTQDFKNDTTYSWTTPKN